MTPRRRALYALVVFLLGLGAWRVARWLLPSEADRLAEQVEGLARRVLAGELEAVLDHVDLERWPLAASAMGEVRTFGPEDAERLLREGRRALDWFPLESAAIDVVDSDVGGELGEDRGRVSVRFSFEDEGQRYADVFDLDLRRVRSAGAPDRWVLTGVHLRTPTDPDRLGGALRRSL